MTRLVLASGSPRRRRLLQAAGFAFDVVVPDVDERQHDGEGPEDMVARLAADKARAVDGPLCVLAADTIVVLDGQVLGKPKGGDDAVATLMQLAGRAHEVHTGFTVTADGSEDTQVVTSKVLMRAASEAEIRAYVATGEPLDKAGSYALQGEGGALVDHVEGSRTNVIGLPMDEVTEALARRGVTPEGA